MINVNFVNSSGEQNKFEKVKCRAFRFKGLLYYSETLEVCIQYLTLSTILFQNDEDSTKCPLCQKTFASKANVRRHMKIHSGTKDYKCEHCEKEFHEKENLMRHIRTIHEGLRHYCNLCPRDFSSQNDLKQHILKIHFND